MKPYLVHKTWIDLDHVLAIGALVDHIVPAWVGAEPYSEVAVEMMFRSEAVRIHLGEFTDSELAGNDRRKAQAILDAFIAAWKGRNCGDGYSTAWLVKKAVS